MPKISIGGGSTTAAINEYTDVKKIDNEAVDGLLGVSNSLAFKVHEIEKHFHNVEWWFGEAVTPSGETHVADLMGDCDDPFTFTAGNDAFGSWVQVLGSSDTPVVSGMVKFDPHAFLVTTTNSTNPFIFQFASGESAGLADKITNKEYGSAPYIAATNNNDSGIEYVMSGRISTSEKLWARVRCVGGNGRTISLFFGIHEYIG